VHLENTNTPNLKALDTNVNIANTRVYYENSLNECDFKTKRKGHLKKHTETIHEGFQYACDQCEYKWIIEKAKSETAGSPCRLSTTSHTREFFAIWTFRVDPTKAL